MRLTAEPQAGGARSFLVLVHPYPPTPSSGAHRWGGIVKYLRRAGPALRVGTRGALGPLAGPGEGRGAIPPPAPPAPPRPRRPAPPPPPPPPPGRGGAQP